MTLYCTSRVILWTPMFACIRTMKSVNTRFPKPVHINKAKILHFTRPIKPKDNRSMAEKCSEERQKKILRSQAITQGEPSSVELWASRQVAKCFNSSQVIAVYHHEGMTDEMRTKLHRRLNKNDMMLKVYSNKICQMAIEGTKIENLAPLLVSQNMFVVSEEASLKKMLQVTDKVPRLHLLGGFVIDRLASAEEMRTIAQMPSLKYVQGQLAGILSTAASRTYQLLQSNQQRLSSNLTQLVKQGNDDEEKQ